MRVAIITGAGQGVGSVIAESFAHKGYKVALVDINKEAGKEQEIKLQEKGLAAKFFFCDLSEETSVRALCDALSHDFAHIDVIIHNAKSQIREKDMLLNLTNEWDTTFKVMLKHPLLMNHLLRGLLRKSSNASIINIGSTNAYFISQQPLAYHVVKGALQQATRYLACEYGSDKIRVNLLHPGIIQVPGRVRRQLELFEKTVEQVIPLRRIAKAEEVASACFFLASDEAQFVTGSTIDLDGGEHLKDHFSLVMSLLKNNEDAGERSIV